MIEPVPPGRVVFFRSGLARGNEVVKHDSATALQPPVSGIFHAYPPRILSRRIDERIVLEAKRLLSHADAPASEVGRQFAFDDASNFSSRFKKQAGMAPAGVRAWSRADRARSTDGT
jgi:AraC-like DNA-binding protein